MLVDSTGRALDAEWTNPGGGTLSAVSGNGTPGGAFDFSVIYLQGDANGDHVVDFADLGILLNNYNQSPSGTLAERWALGDFDNSGTIDFADLGILLNNYNIQLYA